MNLKEKNRLGHYISIVHKGFYVQRPLRVQCIDVELDELPLPLREYSLSGV